MSSPAAPPPFVLPDVGIDAARAQLYGRDGPGWVVVHNAVECDILRHMQRVWTHVAPGWFGPARSNADAGPGSPPYALSWPDGHQTWVQGPWSPPYDAATMAVVWQVQQLRNRIEGRLPWAGLMDFGAEWLQLRVVQNTGPAARVGGHADHAEAPPATPLGGHRADPARLQATLLLSTSGEDWSGGGFWLNPAHGDGPVHLSQASHARAGDLLLWRHSLTHGVDPVTAAPGALGFLRIILPVVCPGPR